MGVRLIRANGNRLTQADSSGTTTLTYDALNRLTQAVYPGTYGTYTWTYDAVGNRTQQTAPAGTTAYTYDANNRLTQAGSTTYAYDANGNLTSLSTGRTFAWDVFNRMTATTAAGSTVTHTYNGDGLKTKRVGPSGTTNYYHDGIRPIWETNSAGAMTAQYDRDIFGNLLSRLESGTRRYYHHDGLGSTTAITDTAGNVSATMLYDAWGNVRTNSGSTQGNYRFTGAERDVTTGLYHMGARFYDPTIGRWLSEDPAQDGSFEPSTLNLYAYVNNNPILVTDLTGLAPEPTPGPSPLYLPSADQELFEQQRGSLPGMIWGAAKGNYKSFAEFLSRFEQLLGTLGYSAGFISAVLAVMAIGVAVLGGIPLAATATAFAVFAVTMTALTLVAQHGTGRISAAQGGFVLGLSALGLWGAGQGSRVYAAMHSGGLPSPGQSGLIISWVSARELSKISSFIQDLILQRGRR